MNVFNESVLMLRALRRKYEALDYRVYPGTELALEITEGSEMRFGYPQKQDEAFVSKMATMKDLGLVKQVCTVNDRTFVYFTYKAWQLSGHYEIKF